MGADTMRFDGETFNPERDGQRLTTQLIRVRDLMGDGHWRTLRQIADAVNGSEAAVSARLRDLRKARFGGFLVARKHQGGGLFLYRLSKPAVKRAGGVQSAFAFDETPS